MSVSRLTKCAIVLLTIPVLSAPVPFTAPEGDVNLDALVNVAQRMLGRWHVHLTAAILQLGLLLAVLPSCSPKPTLLRCGHAVANPPGSFSLDEPFNKESLDRARDEFVRRVEALGYELPYTPEMRVWTRKSVISWREEARAVAIPEWDQLHFKVKQLLDHWAGEEGGLKLFNRAFRWFFPMHELTHFLHTEFGGAPGFCAGEREANDAAVAFRTAQGAAELRSFRALIAGAVVRSVELPVAEGADSYVYFDRHYDEVGRRPEVYGAYQWRFVKDSLSRSDRLDFDRLVTGILTRNGHPTAVMMAPALDVGFHVAAHLQLPDVAITLYDPEYVERAAQAKRDMKFESSLLEGTAETLSKRLNERWQVHRLVRVPALFPDFADTRTAFRLLQGDEQPGPGNARVRARLETLLSLYPSLGTLEGENLELARVLTGLIITEYDGFYTRWVWSNMAVWDRARRRFRDAWYREINPALGVLDPEGRIRQVVIVLSPALRRHGKSFRVVDGIGRVGALLPLDSAEEGRSLLYAFHEICHGISDDLVYAAGYDEAKLSYKQGDEGKKLHILIEHAANQAMFEALTLTNPEEAEKFLADFGSLKWLGENQLLSRHAAIAGRALDSARVQELESGLRTDPERFSRIIYREGLLLPAGTLDAMRRIVRPER